MPRTEMDYSKTIMYRIVSEDPNNNELIYVGHTTNFIQRRYAHKSACNNENDKAYNYKVYETIRANGGWDKFQMIQIEEFNCNNQREAETRERYWLEFYNAQLNSVIPFRTKKEYYNSNKEVLLEKQKEYYEANVDKIKEYYEANTEKFKEQKKEYREINKEQIKEYMKIYYEANNEQMKEKHKEYYEANKDKINERRRIKRQANKIK
jgi:hypothetical protein